MLEVQTWHIPLWHILHRAVDGVGACLSALPGTSVFCRQDETKPKVKSRILLCFLIKAGNRVTIVNPTRQSKQSQAKAGLHLLPFWQTFTHFPTSISIWNLWFKTFEITHRINNPVLARQSEATLLSTLSIMKKKKHHGTFITHVSWNVFFVSCYDSRLLLALKARGACPLEAIHLKQQRKWRERSSHAKHNSGQTQAYLELLLTAVCWENIFFGPYWEKIHRH